MEQVPRIIFLDIDGVLLPFPIKNEDETKNTPWTLLFPPSNLEAFASLVEYCGGKGKVQVVLSSTWRTQATFVQDILDCFAQYTVADGTSKRPLAWITHFADTTSLEHHSERQWEIYHWLRQHGFIAKHGNKKPCCCCWLALDDEDLLEGPSNAKYRNIFQGHCVKTESSKGLTMADVEQAKKRWDAQLAKI